MCTRVHTTMLLLHHPYLLTVILALILYTFVSYIFGRRKPSQLPPGTFGWCPFLGQTLSFVAPHVSTSRGRFLEHNVQRYGKIFRSHLFGHPTIVSCDPDFNSFVLQNEDRFFVSSYPANIPGVLGEHTLLVTTGDVHKRLRAVALSLFATVKSKNNFFLSDIEGSALRIMESWKNKKTLIFCEETRKFTFSVIVKQILSLTPEDPKTAEILRNFTTFMKGLASLPINLPGTSYSRAIQAKHRIKAITKTILQERKKGGRDGQRRMDFMDVLLTHKHLSEEEIESLVLDLLLGGYETTAMLIAIIVKILGDNPKTLADLREEHVRVMREKVGKKKGLGWEEYKNMSFTHSLIDEALRMGNVVKFVHRKAMTTVHYKGYEIPAGWKVLPIFCGVHLDSSVYSNPYQFNPRRWQDEKKNEIALGKKFTPFGGGRRLCPGSELAKLETAIFIHHLVLNFSWAPLVHTDHPMSLPYLDFKHGLQVSIQPLTL